jgi:hypothetical protein
VTTSEGEPPQEAAQDTALKKALDRIESEFDSKKGPRDISDEARAALLDAHAEFLENLGVEAVRAAKRSRLDTVSARHIDEAYVFIQSGSESKVVQGLATVGGIFAGAGAAQFLAVLSEDNPSKLGYVVATAALIVGFIFLIVAWNKTRR